MRTSSKLNTFRISPFHLPERLPLPFQMPSCNLSGRFIMKPRDSGAIRRLYSLVLPYRRTVAAGMLCLLLAVAAELYPPLV